MDRYLGMSFSYNPDTGAMTASMYYSVLKLLATFSTLSLPEQSTPYTLDLFDISEDLTLLKFRFETQLAVIMACSHNDSPTQSDLTKAIRLLAYLKAAAELGPTWYTEDEPILIASCDAAFAVLPHR
jgi:hypothetical protein